MNFSNTRLTKFLIIPIIAFTFTSVANGQGQENKFETQFPTADKTELHAEQEKEQFRNYINQQLEYAEDALYMLETEVMVHKEKMSENVRTEASEMQNNIILYKSVLNEQLETLDDQSEEEWSHTKQNIATFWEDIEEGLEKVKSKTEEKIHEMK